jgi:hypothetical protein
MDKLVSSIEVHMMISNKMQAYVEAFVWIKVVALFDEVEAVLLAGHESYHVHSAGKPLANCADASCDLLPY